MELQQFQMDEDLDFWPTLQEVQRAATEGALTQDESDPVEPETLEEPRQGGPTETRSLQQACSVHAKESGKERRRKRRLRNEPQSIVDVGEGPSGVNVLDYFEARAAEIVSMQKALENKEGGKRVFQKLPRHMRRRAMSHNPKRLPRRLREAAAKEMDTTDDQARKKPSRKQRRKPSSMREEFQRRQRTNAWQETHIWHAKRMKMVCKYGCRLAECCNDKGVRAAHRSLVHGCLMSDISYYCCNEVVGQQSDILASLSELFHMDTGLTIRAKAYLRGQKEGKAVLYKSGGYPHGAIAPVQFLWQAPPPVAADVGGEAATNRENVAKLWIWCHPAAQKEVLHELQAAVKTYNAVSNQCVRHSPTAKDIGAALPVVRVSVSQRNLVRFRLVGPRSHALLMETLRPVGSDKPGGDSGLEGGEEGFGSGSDGCDGLGGEEAVSLPPAEKWWLGKTCCEHLKAHSDVFAASYPALRSASNPAQFSRGSVISLCVQDPRLHTPSKKTDMVSYYYPKKAGYFYGSEPSDGEAVTESCSSETPLPLDVVPPELAYSPLWDQDVCSVVSKSKIPDHLVNRKRSEKFVKCSSLNLGDAAPQVPVLLIQQSPRCVGAAGPTGSLGTGWDLVLPSEWGMVFWVALIYRGARACGLKELRKCSLESHLLHYPEDFPDTSAGREHNCKQRRELEGKYMKKPPKCRLNYGRLLIPTPFHIAWDDCVACWSKGSTTGGPASEESLPNKVESHGVKRPAEPVYEESVPCKKMRVEDSELCNGQVAGEDGLVVTQGSAVGDEMEGSPPNVYHTQEVYVLRSREDLSSLRSFTHVLAKNSDQVFQASMRDFGVDILFEKHSSALVAVEVEILHSGTVSDLDSLSLPSASDLHLVLGSRSFSGPEEVMNKRGLTIVRNEGITVGISTLEREETRQLKKRFKDPKKDVVSISDFKLLPVCPSRKTIGRVTTAGLNLTTSLSSGMGFVTLGGLVEAVKCCHDAGAQNLLVLARGATTKYYFVKLHVM